MRMSEEKSIFNFHGNQNQTGSVFGQTVSNVTIINHNTDTVPEKSKEEQIQEILDNYANYLSEIDKLDINREDKKVAKDAIYMIQEELHEEKPDVEKIQSCSDKLKKSSEVASICSAVFGLLQLLQ